MGAQPVAAAPTWSWAVPLAAAIVTALVAFTGVMISVVLQWRSLQRQITSAHTLRIAEMRQGWINSLRETMATFQSYGVTPSVEQATVREFYESGTHIELFMNPSDPDYNELHDCLYQFLAAEHIEEKFAVNARYVAVCQRILKREWEVLKRDLKAAGGLQEVGYRRSVR